MRLRLFHSSRFVVATAGVAALNFFKPSDYAVLAVIVWMGYAALVTVPRIWREGWRGFVLITCGYIAIALGCGGWSVPTLAEVWACTAVLALIVDVRRWGPWLTRRCIRAWRERRERKRSELDPVTIAVQRTLENIDANEILFRLGLAAE